MKTEPGGTQEAEESVQQGGWEIYSVQWELESAKWKLELQWERSRDESG